MVSASIGTLECPGGSSYTILKKFGEGAYGIVYQAEDGPEEQQVAIKFFPNNSDLSMEEH